MFAKLGFLAVLFLFFGNPSEENSTYHKDYYETGNLKAEGWLKNGIKTDYWKFYYPNGTLYKEGHYKNDKKENYWHFYGTNGKTLEEGHFKNDLRSGWWLFYDTNGKINHKCQLQYGRKNGYCLRYTNQKLASAEKYTNGEKIKEWFTFGSFKRENNLSDLK